MDCIFCGDKLTDNTKDREFHLTDYCQSSFWRDAYLVVFFICENRKIAVFDKHYWIVINKKCSSFKREYDWVESDCHNHEEFEFVDRRIIDTGFIF